MTGTPETGFARPAVPIMVHAPSCQKPAPRYLCRCGQNVVCSTCGWGSGSHPCLCARERMTQRVRRFA